MKIFKTTYLQRSFLTFCPMLTKESLKNRSDLQGSFLKNNPGFSGTKSFVFGKIIFTISPGFPGRYMACPCELGGKSTKPVTQVCRVIGHPLSPAGNMRKIHFAIVVDIWVGFQFLKICPRVHIPKFDFSGGFSFSGLNPGLSSRVSAIRVTQTVPKKNSQKANSLYSALKKGNSKNSMPAAMDYTKSGQEPVTTRLGKGYGRQTLTPSNYQIIIL